MAAAGQQVFEEVHRFHLRLSPREEQNPSCNDVKRLRRYQYPDGPFRYAQTLQVQDEEIAELMLGPIFHEALNEDGFDGIAYREAIKHVPVVDGQGFDAKTAGPSGGFGLQGIRERIQRPGGESVPAEGTRLKVRVPIL